MKLSKSKILCYQQCPLKFKFQYIDKIQKPKPPALEKGIEIHSLIEGILRGQPNGEKDKYPGVIDNVQGFLKWMESINLRPDKDMIECYVVDKDKDIHGYIDAVFIGDELAIIDWKSGKPKTIDDVRFELSLYALMFYMTFGKKPDVIGAYYVEHDKFVYEELTDESINNAIINVNIARLGMSSGCFDKQPSYLCGWCEYREECESKERWCF